MDLPHPPFINDFGNPAGFLPGVEMLLIKRQSAIIQLRKLHKIKENGQGSKPVKNAQRNRGFFIPDNVSSGVHVLFSKAIHGLAKSCR